MNILRDAAVDTPPGHTVHRLEQWWANFFRSGPKKNWRAI